GSWKVARPRGRAAVPATASQTSQETQRPGHMLARPRRLRCPASSALPLRRLITASRYKENVRTMAALRRYAEAHSGGTDGSPMPPFPATRLCRPARQVDQNAPARNVHLNDPVRTRSRRTAPVSVRACKVNYGSCPRLLELYASIELRKTLLRCTRPEQPRPMFARRLLGCRGTAR